MNDTALLSVPAADEQDVTYYGLPSVKPSLWGGLVSSYMFVAGVGGSAQIIASAADLVGDPALAPIVRNGRYIALGATVLGGPLLIIDLHTPQRWYNMLRIFRKTSPMSIGTWVLMSFGPLSAALAAAQFTADRGHSPSRAEQRAIKLLQIPAALTGMAMSTYTGALLSATSTPLWAAAPRRITAAFGASAMASGAAALTIAGLRRSASDNTRQALDLIGLAASTLELFLLLSLWRRFREQGVDGALSESGWGLAYDLGAVAIGAGVPVLHHVESMIKPKQPSRPALVIPLAVLAGGFLLRHVLLRAGNVSAKRPKDYFRHRKSASVSSDCCRVAIAALDRALEDRPDKIYHDLAEVVRCLVLLRTELTARRREGEAGDRLDRCNAILSMVIGGEYPLAGLRRDRLQKARNELATLLDER